ncbi:sel1 repeat family protein, partial [Alphaproteobacteria bacterium]|nr:sel1 repeat family protein [Alphaproteobacteria bacterium]
MVDIDTNLKLYKEAYEEEKYKEALEYLIPLAEEGNSEAQCYLGKMYSYGYGVKENDKTAVKWYMLAAKKGYIRAQYDLANAYADGLGVKKNYKTAVKWYKLTAEKDMHQQAWTNIEGEDLLEYTTLAKFKLGEWYYHGGKVKQDYEIALKWFMLADKDSSNFSDKKDVYEASRWAQYYLGKMYKKGHGVEQNYITAAKWFRISSEKIYKYDNLVWLRYVETNPGYDEAQYELGKM